MGIITKLYHKVAPPTGLFGRVTYKFIEILLGFEEVFDYVYKIKRGVMVTRQQAQQKDLEAQENQRSGSLQDTE